MYKTLSLFLEEEIKFLKGKRIPASAGMTEGIKSLNEMRVYENINIIESGGL